MKYLCEKSDVFHIKSFIRLRYSSPYLTQCFSFKFEYRSKPFTHVIQDTDYFVIIKIYTYDVNTSIKTKYSYFQFGTTDIQARAEREAG